MKLMQTVILLILLLIVASAQRAQSPGPQLDVAALIHESISNNRAMNKRLYDYTWISKRTVRDVNKRGEVTKETVEVDEIYIGLFRSIHKLISRNGIPVSPKSDEKERRRVAERLAKDEAKRRQAEALAPNAPGPDFGVAVNMGSKHEVGFSLIGFLRAGEFHSPRRERLKDRHVIALDFKPRADFRPTQRFEVPLASLAGTVWIDEVDKIVVRLEAWPAAAATAANTVDSASAQAYVRPEPVFITEYTRLPDGMWVQSFVRINTTKSRDLFNGAMVDWTSENNDFLRFNTRVDDAQVEAPRQQL